MWTDDEMGNTLFSQHAHNIKNLRRCLSSVPLNNEKPSSILFICLIFILS